MTIQNELTQEDILAEKEEALVEKIADILLAVGKFRTATDDPLIWLVEDPLCAKAAARLKASYPKLPRVAKTAKGETVIYRGGMRA